jgi:hypothetical protein
MSFHRKLAAYSVAAGLAVSAGVAIHADPIKLEYHDVALTSPEAVAIWGDRIADAANPVRPPGVSIADVSAGGRDFQVSMFFSDTCGPMYCPVRVFEDGKVVDEFLACRNISMHEVSESGRALLACDDIIVMDTRVGQ